ncbi:type I 3-dehydroquinate dehydratase [Patescibacteria group bacterium]
MICIPLKYKSLNTLLKKHSQAQKKADVMEIWFDEISIIKEEELKKFFRQKRKPIIYKAGKNIKKISKIINYKTEYIDLDVATSSNIINNVKKQSPKTKLIISYHNFKKTPPQKELEKIISKIKKKKADIIKIATYAKNFQDSLRMLELLSQESKKSKIICICMGKQGEITRAAGHLLGNYLMYAPLESKQKTAPGQIEFDDLKKIQNML